MNCQRFEDVANDIAREQMIDAGARAAALRHTDECHGCAEKLENELGLTLRLRGLMENMESVGAPARVQADLLAAFDELALIQLPPQVSARRYWGKHLIGAIAAGLVLMFGVSAILWRATVGSNGDTRALLVAGSRTPLSITITSPPPIMVRSEPLDSRRKTPNRQRVGAPLSSGRGNAGSTEIATDFLPLTYGAATNLEEGGRMVRVELPHSAMATFGLPVNMDRANERVKADVLLGVDGVAQAIRFVR